MTAPVRHYVRDDDLRRSVLYGDAIEALCGQRIVIPRGYTALKVCPACALRAARVGCEAAL